jgi:hypothetical protein
MIGVPNIIKTLQRCAQTDTSGRYEICASLALPRSAVWSAANVNPALRHFHRDASWITAQDLALIPSRRRVTFHLVQCPAQ